MATRVPSEDRLGYDARPFVIRGLPPRKGVPLIRAAAVFLLRNAAMTQDQLTYRRAANAALAGLGVQLVLTVVVAVLTAWSQSAALQAATWYLLGGTIIWVALWLVYNQHRLERTEALEADQLAADAGTDGSMFDEAGHELALSRKRLEGFYRWGLSAVSVVVAVYLLGVGGWMLYSSAGLINLVPNEDADFTSLYAKALANPKASVLALMLTAAALALAGFLTARYVAGMTQEKTWQLLRGGSAYLMGNVAVLAAVVLAAVFEMADNRIGFAVLTLAVPLLMVVLGLEAALSLVFGAYRPRQPDETIRPAFDSRLLGWLTRPDSLGQVVAETLNYQFGFEVSRSWFYRLFSKAIIPLILLGMATLIAMSCVVIVPPQEQALVTTFGEIAPDSAVRNPGVSFKAPWPFATVRKYETSRIRSLRVGSLDDDDRTGAAMLWTNQHAKGGENYLLTSAARGADDAQQGAVSAGLIGGELVLQWRITDLIAYTSPDAPARPTDFLRTVAESAFAQYLVTKDIDTLLTSDRLDAAKQLRRDIQSRVAPMGIEVIYAGLYGLHPPQDSEVADAFLKVVNALLTQRTTVTEAQRDRVATLSEVAGSVDQAVAIDHAITLLESLPQSTDNTDARAQRAADVQWLIDNAGGEAARVIAQARADRWKLALNEQARAKSFAFELDAYRRAPQYFKARAYFNVLAQTLPGTRKIITAADTGNELPIIRLNLEDESSGLDSFLGASE